MLHGIVNLHNSRVLQEAAEAVDDVIEKILNDLIHKQIQQEIFIIRFINPDYANIETISYQKNYNVLYINTILSKYAYFINKGRLVKQLY